MPKFSVVIPAYNQQEFIGAAIQSVLDQTFTDFEVIVVNDASPDHTEEVVMQFSDPRIRYIVHPMNRGLPSARNTGMRASGGEYIALLDADDIFEKKKLEAHNAFLVLYPEIGVSYNARFEFHHSSETIRDLHRPKQSVDLSDLVLGFPFAPSDMVIRRDWTERVGFFDELLINGAEDIDYPCRLALAGCKFASVDQALNFRRYHTNRIYKNLKKRKTEYDLVLNRTFNDPRCSLGVRSLYGKSISKRNLNLAYVALLNGDSGFGNELLREAVRYYSSILEGEPNEIINLFLMRCINDENLDHETVLRSMFSQFPPEIAPIQGDIDCAIRRGYILKGLRAVTWGKVSEGKALLDRVNRSELRIDKYVQDKILIQLLNIEEVLGGSEYKIAIDRLFPVINNMGESHIISSLDALLSVNRAFRYFHKCEFSKVPEQVIHAILKNPNLAKNKGIMSILLRSVIKNRYTPSG